MGRTKSPVMRREPSDIHSHSNGVVHQNGYVSEKLEEVKHAVESTEIGARAVEIANQPGTLEMFISICGIYGAFLTWGFLQERITTTTYGTPSSPERFKYPVFLNTVQSLLAAFTGFIYLTVSTKHPHKPGRPLPIFPSRAIVYPLLLVAFTSALSSPFGYASLAHIDYVTFILAKSCKLLPVMFLQTTVFRRRYPLYKYIVVFLVTLGVAVFTLHHPATANKASKHASKSSEERNVTWGLLLLGINLLFDGLMNSTQDYIFQTFKPFSAPQMMCAMNLTSSFLTSLYLVLSPYVAQTPVGAFLGMGKGDELREALDFVTKYPSVGYDVVAFGFCGAVGQVFIFYVVSNFSSLVLVTVTVTRKMLTMLLSVIWFGHTLTPMQYLGVGLVFGGIGSEAYIGKREKDKKAKAKGKKDS
ncbi:UAA transporter [Rhizodiscina lignyota]|uniref:UDP-galactose transporter homolog 1 n=1 Tax=Rhizodiscina lignyota TaxID=1504668 RepID=A0A9P4IHR3_9PEZI|nr:UAA transporter [Rhizodiscina lignyota]